MSRVGTPDMTVGSTLCLVLVPETLVDRVFGTDILPIIIVRVKFYYQTLLFDFVVMKR